MKKARILSIILAVVTLFAIVLTGCGTKDSADKNTAQADYAVILKPLSNDFWAKMKAGIEVALSHHAKLLILDEATSGLDPVVRDEVLDILNEFTRDENHSILISSHIVSDLEKCCDYIAFLHRGKLILCEEKDVLLASYGIVNLTPVQLAELPSSSILHQKNTGYGIQALVKRDAIPVDISISPVTIEELFVQLVKEYH